MVNQSDAVATIDSETAAQAAAEELALSAQAKRASAKLLEDAQSGKMSVPLTPDGLLKNGDPSVLCHVPKRVPLTLDANHGHRRVEFPVGTYPVPNWLVTEYPVRVPGNDTPVLGMHFYLAAHGVSIVGDSDAPRPKLTLSSKK